MKPSGSFDKTAQVIPPAELLKKSRELLPQEPETPPSPDDIEGVVDAWAESIQKESPSDPEALQNVLDKELSGVIDEAMDALPSDEDIDALFASLPDTAKAKHVGKLFEMKNRLEGIKNETAASASTIVEEATSSLPEPSDSTAKVHTPGQRAEKVLEETRNKIEEAMKAKQDRPAKSSSSPETSSAQTEGVHSRQIQESMKAYLQRNLEKHGFKKNTEVSTADASLSDYEQGTVKVALDSLPEADPSKVVEILTHPPEVRVEHRYPSLSESLKSLRETIESSPTPEIQAEALRVFLKEIQTKSGEEAYDKVLQEVAYDLKLSTSEVVSVISQVEDKDVREYLLGNLGIPQIPEGSFVTSLEESLDARFQESQERVQALAKDRDQILQSYLRLDSDPKLEDEKVFSEELKFLKKDLTQPLPEQLKEKLQNLRSTPENSFSSPIEKARHNLLIRAHEKQLEFTHEDTRVFHQTLFVQNKEQFFGPEAKETSETLLSVGDRVSEQVLADINAALEATDNPEERAHLEARKEQELKNREKEARLRKPIDRAINLGGGQNRTALVGFEGESSPAVYKGAVGEEFLRFYIDQGTYHKREWLAFQIDRALGLDVVPPTIVREDGPDGLGSLQDWEAGQLADQVAWSNESQKESLQRIALFDHLVRNTDRHRKNFLITGDRKVIAIDNSLILPSQESGVQSLRSHPLLATKGEHISPDMRKNIRFFLSSSTAQEGLRAAFKATDNNGSELFDQFIERLRPFAEDPNENNTLPDSVVQW